MIMFISSSGIRSGHFLDNLDAILANLDVNNPTLIMDNASVHHGAVSNGATSGGVPVRFLPAYSPFLNPIENVFSV